MIIQDIAGAVKISFDVRSSRIARLTVERSNASFGLRRPDPYDCVLGFETAPLYRITLPDTPVDDRLRVTAMPSGQFVQEDINDVHEALRAYRDWARGSAAANGGGLISLLPAGEYCLARTSRQPHFEEKIILGNERVDSPPGVLTLLHSPTFYSYIFGPSEHHPANLNSTLLGIPVLNYLGIGDVHGVLLFACVAGNAAVERGIAVKDLVVVVPMSGELILNTKVGWPPKQHEQDQARWRTRLGEEFIQTLTEV